MTEETKVRCTCSEGLTTEEECEKALAVEFVRLQRLSYGIKDAFFNWSKYFDARQQIAKEREKHDEYCFRFKTKGIKPNPDKAKE